MMVRTSGRRPDMAELGPGERAELARRRKLIWVVGIMFVAGAVAGGAVGYTEVGEGGFEGATIAPWLAIILTGVFLATVILGGWLMKRHVDEHEIGLHTASAAWGGTAFAVAFPAWFLLWKGRLVPEPSALALFGVFYAASLAGYLIKKYR